MMNMQGLMKQAQMMQKKMEEAQKKLAESEVTGSSGGGMVKCEDVCRKKDRCDI